MSALAAETGALNLGQGFPDEDGPAEIADAAIEAIRSGVNQYAPLPGHPALRLAIAEHQERFWSLRVDPDTEVVVTAGATEAIAAALLGLCDPGDEVVAFDPTYDSYGAGVAMAGARLRTVVLRPQPDSGRFEFDRDELAATVNDATRVLLLNTPHNPTGKVFDEDELAFIAELCVRHDVIALTDEVYEHLVLEGRHRPLAGFEGMAERTVTVSSAGKTFSFTGWKIGWATGPAPLIGTVRTAKQYLTFANGSPFQPAIAVGLRLGDDYFDTLAATMLAKRDVLCDGLEAAGLDVYRPQGTYFATVDIGPTSGIDFCLALPGRAGVVAVPTSVFYQNPADGDHLIRFCFAKKTAMLVEAGRRLNQELS